MNCNVTEIGKTLAQEVQYKFFLLNGSQKKKFQGSNFFYKNGKNIGPGSADNFFY